MLDTKARDRRPRLSRPESVCTVWLEVILFRNVLVQIRIRESAQLKYGHGQASRDVMILMQDKFMALETDFPSSKSLRPTPYKQL
jgi:hypothetical protein